MSNSIDALKNSTNNAYYFLIALLPGMVLTTYYAGLIRDNVDILYKDNSAVIKLGVAISTALIIELVMLIVTRQKIIGSLKNPQALLIGLLLALCLPNSLRWWEVSLSIAFAIIVGRYLLNNRLYAVLVGYVFSLAAFPTSHGLSMLIKNELYDSYALEINGAFALGGLFLAYKQLINWRTPLALLIIYSAIALTFKSINIDIPFSILIIRSLFTSTTCLSIFFIAPFVMGDKPSDQTCWGTGAIAGIILFLLSNYAQYPDALLLILLITNVSYWAINAKNISLDHIHIATITSHSLLTPILAASAVMVIASSFTQAALVGITVIGIYLGVQSIIDVFKRYIPQSSLLSLVIVLTAFLSTYISLSIKVYLPALSQTIDGAIPLLALSSLILSYSSIFTGNHTPFKMVNALKTSTLFLLLVLLVGGISQFTDLNRIFSAGLFFLFAFIALCNNQKLSTIETTNNKPNRRVRTTGTIK